MAQEGDGELSGHSDRHNDVSARGVVIALVVALFGTAWAVDGMRQDTNEPAPPESAEPDPPLPREAREQRLAVVWSSIRLSDDRRTVTVTTWYPLAGFCIKEADGVDVEVRGDTAVVAAWMRGPELPMPENTACTMECGFVTQSVTLSEPLPDHVSEFEPAGNAVATCA